MTDTITITESTHKDCRLELDGMKIHLQRMDYTARAYKTRIYTSGAATTPDWEHPPYGSQRGDGSPEDKAWKKYNREESRLQRVLAQRALDALEREGVKLYGGDKKLWFSRYAGCSCPCSPGVIVNATAYAEKPLFPYDTKIASIWVESATKR